MSFSDTKLKPLFFILFFSLFSIVQATNWYQLSEDNSLPYFNNVAGEGGGLHSLFAVANNGMHYYSDNGGLDWQGENTGISDNLNGIALMYDWSNDNPVTVEIAVGDNGRVLKSYARSGIWTSIDTLGTVNYAFAQYVWSYNQTFIGGQNSQCYYTYDLGLHWYKVNLPSNDFNLLGMEVVNGFYFLFAERNDTTFVLTSAYDPSNFQITTGDTLPNTKYISSTTTEGTESNALYYLLRDRTSGDALIFERFDGYTKTPEAGRLVFSGDLGTPTALKMFAKSVEQSVFWLTNLEGEIWESHNWGGDWFLSYSDPQRRELYGALTSGYDHDHGRAFGSNGLVLKYGFELTQLDPGPNSNSRSDFPRVTLRFSLVPDLDSLATGIHIQSQQRGTIPFELEQDANDFRITYLNVSNAGHSTQIPGDKWNISFADNLRAEGDTLNELFESFSYDVNIVSPQATSFKFSGKFNTPYLGGNSTNWVTGLINQDDYPDLVTYSRDTLFCYSRLDNGEYQLNRIGLAAGVQIDINLKDQLLLSDVNLDGLPDVILYDSENIRIYLNQSGPTTVDFIGPTTEKFQRGITKIIPYNANNNGEVDLLILASSFYTQFDITPTDFGNFTQNVFNGAPIPKDAYVADLDNDGNQDLVIIDGDEYLYIYRGQGFGNFDEYGYFRSTSPAYKAVKIADLNDDKLPEILAARTTSLDMYGLNSPGNWDFNQNFRMNLVDLGQQAISDFAVQDFGGPRFDDKGSQLDILVLSSDSLRIWQNNTMPGAYPVIERVSQWSLSNETATSQILVSDFNRDNTLDFASCNLAYGQFSVWEKLTWKPIIENISFDGDVIHLYWTSSPDDMGTLAYYRVFRDNKPEISEFAFVRTTSETQFDDYEFDPYDSLYYAVQAVYTDGSESDISQSVFIDPFIKLDGAVSGVLSDTTKEYLVRNGIWVPAGSSLEIQKGVRIGFRKQAYFDVYGGLVVQGEWPDQMVDFHSADSLPWGGIYLAPSVDTVRFNWFSVEGADTALGIDDRPFKAKLGGIIENKMGLIARGDSLTLENVIFDSNMVAVEINTGQQALLKNVNILHSLTNSVTVKGDSRTHIRNSIIWDNNGQIQRDSGTPYIRVTYSTVDHMQPLILHHAISQLSPVFMPPDSGFYRPAYMSPTIDAGDPGDSFMDEPAPNGNRVNQGLFGGTFLATPSLQPRLEPAKDHILLAARLGQMDTSGVWIINKGFATLHINEIFLTGENPVFQVIGNPETDIEPGDSSRINIVFTPASQGDFRDTLRIVSDDPHLIDSSKDISIFGRCTLLTPVVKLLPLSKIKQKQAAIRFRYTVVDSGEGVTAIKRSSPDSYQLYTSLVRMENSDTIEAFQIDTSHVDYANLPDGSYLFKIWAVPFPGEPGEQNVKSQNFTVSVQERDALRHRWYMLSIPSTNEVNWEDFALGDSSAYLLKWNNEEEQYDEVEAQRIPVGQAFWAFTLKKIHLDLKMLESGGNSIKLAGENGVELVAGWNQVGIPERFNLFWNKMQIESLSSGTALSFVDAVQNGMVDGAVYHYEHTPDFQGYIMDVVDSTSMAEPWRGYWLYANQPGVLYFPNEPAFAGDSANTTDVTGPESGLAKNGDSNWQLNISLNNDTYWDSRNIIGINPDNRVIIHEPPHMGDFCALYLPTEKGNLAQQLQGPFKNASEVKTWNLQMATRSAGKPHTVSWDTKILTQNNVYLYFVDAQNETVINMNREKSYTFTPKNGKSSFEIYATKDESFRPQLVPLTFTLKQNYPNPFNPETTIRFGVPASAQDAQTTLTVYNILGEKIAVIFSGHLKMGFHEFKWNGKNLLGKNVASGVYFYKLKSGKTSIIKKMVLVR